MAITQTARLKLPQWGSGADGPSRVGFNTAFANIDQRAAYDDGAAGGTSLPTDEVVAGRYAQTTDGNYRRLYRRIAGAWQQVGGNTWSETQYARADASLSTGADARITSHPSLSNPSVVERWDGTTIRGARQSIGDVNSGLPGALHVGDTTSAVDLANRGRVYVRTTGSGHRGVVASAYGSGSGPLFAAREPGGTEPWLVDALGRMRSQAPTAFGGASLVDYVPVSIAPGANDVSALDVAAASSKPALRVFRSLSDSTPIASFAQDRITLGRASWSGGRVDVLGPGLYVASGLEVDGAANLDGALDVAGRLDVAGDANFADVTADEVVVSGLVRGAQVTATGALSAESGRISTQQSGSGALVLSRPPTQYSGTAQQSLRSPVVYFARTRPDLTIPSSSDVNLDQTVVMGEDGWMRLDLDLLLTGDLPAIEMPEVFKVYVLIMLRQGSTTLAQNRSLVAIGVSDARSRNKPGQMVTHITEVFEPRLSAGSYTIRVALRREGVLAGQLTRANFTVMPVMLHSASYTSS